MFELHPKFYQFHTECLDGERSTAITFSLGEAINNFQADYLLE
jgi:hypothetical protein